VQAGGKTALQIYLQVQAGGKTALQI